MTATSVMGSEEQQRRNTISSWVCMVLLLPPIPESLVSFTDIIQGVTAKGSKASDAQTHIGNSNPDELKSNSLPALTLLQHSTVTDGFAVSTASYAVYQKASIALCVLQCAKSSTQHVADDETPKLKQQQSLDVSSQLQPEQNSFETAAHATQVRPSDEVQTKLLGKQTCQ